MKPIVTAFAGSPDHGEGHSRDFRVRWALEEVRQPYDVRLVPWKKFKEPEHRKRHPFAKIPTYEQDGQTLFESGAILLHIAHRYSGLLPTDVNAREQAVVWMFAALSTVEPPIVEREAALLMEKDQPWFADRQKLIDGQVSDRLTDLAEFLGRRDWLTGDFTVADLLMITVLRRLEPSNIEEDHSPLQDFPSLLAYVQRGKDRPAYAQALEAEKADFERTRDAGEDG